MAFSLEKLLVYQKAIDCALSKNALESMAQLSGTIATAGD